MHSESALRPLSIACPGYCGLASRSSPHCPCRPPPSCVPPCATGFPVLCPLHPSQCPYTISKWMSPQARTTKPRTDTPARRTRTMPFCEPTRHLRINCKCLTPCTYQTMSKPYQQRRGDKRQVQCIASLVFPTFAPYVFGKPAMTPSSMESVTSAITKSAIVIYIRDIEPGSRGSGWLRHRVQYRTKTIVP